MKMNSESMGTLSVVLLVVLAAAFATWKLLKWKKNGTLKQNVVKYVTDMFEGFDNFHIMTQDQKEKLLSLLSVDQLNSVLRHIGFGNQAQIEGFLNSVKQHLYLHNTVKVGDELIKLFSNSHISTRENGAFWMVKNKNTAKTDFVFLLKEDEKFDHTDILNLAISYTAALKDFHLKNNVSVKIFEVKANGELRICKTYTPREIAKFVARMLAANPHLLQIEDAK